MNSTKCLQCGFVGWPDQGKCKGCGAQLMQHFPAPFQPHVAHNNYASRAESQEGPNKGLAIFALVLGIISFLTFGLLGMGALTGIIIASVALGKVKRNPWKYGGRGMAIAGLILSITSLAIVVPFGIVAAIAIPNLLAARMAANEASAMYSLRKIAAAEGAYQDKFERYGTLDELAVEQLIDPALGSGLKNGYKFKIELTTNDDTNEPGFEIVSVPTTYQSSGRRSFYIDDSFVIRGVDNRGAPATEFDSPVDSDYDFPRSYQPRPERDRAVDY
jgi:type IV pilus assembly protein PilA